MLFFKLSIFCYFCAFIFALTLHRFPFTFANVRNISVNTQHFGEKFRL